MESEKKDKKKKEDKTEGASASHTKPDPFQELKSMIANLNDNVSTLGGKFNSLEKRVDTLSSDQHDQAKLSEGEDSFSLPPLREDQDDDLGAMCNIDQPDESFAFDSCVQEPIVGDDIDDELAMKVNEGLVRKSNWDKVKQTKTKYLRPHNLYALRTPAVNNELLRVKTVRQSITTKDSQAKLTQDLITASLAASTDLLSELKYKEVDRAIMYEKVSDITKLLIDSHKRMSQIRRNQLRPLINERYRGVCASDNLTNDNNEWLFGSDIGRSADEVVKANQITSKILDSHPKNGYRGRDAPYRGRDALRGKFPPRGRGRGHSNFNLKRKETGTYQVSKFPKKE